MLMAQKVSSRVYFKRISKATACTMNWQNQFSWRLMPLAVAMLQVTGLTSNSRTHFANAFTVPFHMRMASTFNTGSPFRKGHVLKSALAEENDLMNESNQEKPELSERYVIIRKNRQSMAFRNGSPLVFSGAIENTYHIAADASEEDGIIPIGSLVGVLVSGNKDIKSGRRPPKRRGRQQKPVEEISYDHFLIDIESDSAQKFSSAGNLTGTLDDTEQIDEALSDAKIIGFGIYNPESMYRVRLLCHQTSHPELFKGVKKIMSIKAREGGSADDAIELILRTKIQDAIRARMSQNLPSTSTDSYRLLNGEGDGISGLAIDILGGQVAVIMSSAAWCEIYKDTILKVVKDLIGTEHPSYSSDETGDLEFVWRNTPSRLKQDGYHLPRDSTEDEEEGDIENNYVIATENDIRYKTHPLDLSSQKTGFYCDQRDNRLDVAKLCEGKRVLDLCCYNGGFALNAMVHGGASSCIGVDSSPAAINDAIGNAELNNIDPDKISFVRDDIHNFMKSATENGDKYDVVVLDPPKVSKTLHL
jgi:23S rRNA G2069 N7-methylase RlmK/C1962 C5-methylase RlmI